LSFAFPGLPRFSRNDALYVIARSGSDEAITCPRIAMPSARNDKKGPARNDIMKDQNDKQKGAMEFPALSIILGSDVVLYCLKRAERQFL